MAERITTDKLVAEKDAKTGALLVYRKDKGKPDAIIVPIAKFERWLAQQWRTQAL